MNVGSSAKGSVSGERLEVTVIPEDSHPYNKTIQIPSSLIGKLFLQLHTTLSLSQKHRVEWLWGGCSRMSLKCC